jgi:(p)ppGpp synthase/HD superfamily hydrolase
VAHFKLTLEVKDVDHLQGIMDRIAALSDVMRVARGR